MHSISEDFHFSDIIPKLIALTLIGSEGFIAVKFLYFKEYSAHNTIFIQILALLLCVSFVAGLLNLFFNTILDYFSLGNEECEAYQDCDFKTRLFYDTAYLMIIGSTAVLSLITYFGKNTDSRGASFCLALSCACGIMYVYENLILILDCFIKYKPGLLGIPSVSDHFSRYDFELLAERRRITISSWISFFALVGALDFISLYNFAILLTYDHYRYRGIAVGVCSLTTFIFTVFFVLGLWKAICECSICYSLAGNQSTREDVVELDPLKMNLK